MEALLAIKGAIALYAGVAALRARFGPGAWLLPIAIALGVVLPLALFFEVAGPPGALARAHPWAAPLGSAVAWAAAARVAFRAVEDERAGSERRAPLEGVGYAAVLAVILEGGLALLGVLTESVFEGLAPR